MVFADTSGVLTPSKIKGDHDMDHIVEIPVSNKEHWNETVKSIKNYDAFYLNEYVDAFMREDESNGMPVLLYYENGADRAINVVFQA